MIHINLVNELKYFTLQPVLNKVYKYRFESIIEDFANPKRIKRISYVKNVSITLYEQTEIVSKFQLFLSKVNIESKTTEPNEYLVKQMGYAFDEIEVGVNYKGKIVSVYNIKEMSIRWEITKEELLIHNKGQEIESAFESISNLLRNEEELMAYLSDYKMYGLYFTEFFGKNYIWEMPIIRNKSLIDYENTDILEKIYPEKTDKVYYHIFGETHFKRIPIVNGYETYHGKLSYTDNQLEVAYLETVKEDKKIKYNVLLLG